MSTLEAILVSSDKIPDNQKWNPAAWLCDSMTRDVVKYFQAENVECSESFKANDFRCISCEHVVSTNRARHAITSGRKNQAKTTNSQNTPGVFPKPSNEIVTTHDL